VDSVDADAHAAEREPARAPALRLGPEAPERVPAPRTPLARLAAGLGNRALGRVLTRMRDGAGILAGGAVHPDVQAAIGASRGSGSALDRSVAEALAPAMGGPLDDVRVHTGPAAAELARAVTARAFTVGSDIYFGSGEYKPGTPDGNALIAHEVAHTVQQRGAPLHGPLSVSQPGDALEREADAVARDALG